MTNIHIPPHLDISVIIVNWNTRQLLAQAIRSVQQTFGKLSVEIIVVDNGSTDGSQDMLRSHFPLVKVVQNTENVGFARANNQGARLARGEFLLLLNSDAELYPNAMQSMLEVMRAHPKAGIVGANLRNPGGSFQASHTPFPTLTQEFLILSGLGRALYGAHYPSRGPEEDIGPQRVDYIEGACMLIRREPYLEVGGMDEGYFMYAEEVDLCYTFVQHGWEVWYQPAARVLHHGGGSSRNRRAAREGDLYQSRVRFFRKWRGSMQAEALKALIYLLTFVKWGIHNALRILSHGRRGRTVISPSALHQKLKT
ncbi:MAG: glycosyltransferase family 2 protein, partial [Anaerolineae bacterium]